MNTRLRCATLLTVALVCGACASGDEMAEQAAPVFALDRDVAAEVDPVDTARENVLPAFQLRLVLQSLLTEHATLSNEAMRRAIDGTDATATADELTRNTDGLTMAIGLVYGPEGASAFDQLWTNHIQFFNDYAAAIKAGDDELAAEVTGSLTHYETDFSDFIEVATSGTLDFATVASVLHSHVQQLLDQADQWNGRDHAASYELGEESFRHVDVIATALATGISAQQPDVFPGDVASPVLDDCAATRLAVRLAITARADVALATRSGNSANLDAATAEFDDAASDARSRLDESEVGRLEQLFEEVDGADNVPAARSTALAHSDADVSGAQCSFEG